MTGDAFDEAVALANDDDAAASRASAAGTWSADAPAAATTPEASAPAADPDAVDDPAAPDAPETPDASDTSARGVAAGASTPQDAAARRTGASAPGTASAAARHSHGHGRDRHSWPAARAAAHRAIRDPLPETSLSLGLALDQVLAGPLPALTDLPSFDTSAMDGWAVAGPGPWQVADHGDRPRRAAGRGSGRGSGARNSGARGSGGRSSSPGAGVLAGQDEPEPLPDGHAVPIATGARIPPGTSAVLRSEYGELRASGRRLHAAAPPEPGADIRPRGQECRSGDELLPAGTVVNPAVLGLAAAAGYDELSVVPRPRVDLLVLGDELLHSGLPCGGRIRDALGPMAGPWVEAFGGYPGPPRFLGDDAEALFEAVTTSTADLVVTTGGTAAGPVDHVHSVLDRAGATLLVDGVAVRPGHPMLLAGLPTGGCLVGLPGNPLAAVSGLLTLVEPVLCRLSGRSLPEPAQAALSGEVSAHPEDTRLVPVRNDGPGTVRPVRYAGPAMLRGIAAADALAVIPPGRTVRAGDGVRLLRLPWT